MKLNLVTFLILLLACQLCYSQSKKVPKNIKQAVEILQSNCPDSLKKIIKNTKDEKLQELSYPWGGQYKTIFYWLAEENKDIKISKYLIDNGISYNPHQETIILIAFKKKLLNKPIDEKVILKPYQDIELKWAKEDKVRFTTDTLRGIYIPKDLEDCFKQIDKFWSDSTKRQVKTWTEDEFFQKTYRFGIGLWIRNNWQLWGGSRLTAYFNKLGAYNPESISVIILTSYHRHLSGKEIKFADQIAVDKKGQAKMKMDDSLNKLKEFKEYQIGDTVIYKYRFGYTSKKQKDDSDNDACKANGIITEKNDSTFLLRVKIIETCDKKGIIIYDTKDSYVYDAVLKKWVKPKKRRIIKAYKNDIKWFNYDFWEVKD